MEDQLIAFETAKLAKEKGFNHRCRYYFIDDLIKDNKTYTDYALINYNLSQLFINRMSCPTQSLLQRWLREAHEIQIEISTRYKADYIIGYSHSIYISAIDRIENELNFINNNVIIYDKYEVANEMALFEALKLIA